MATITLQQGVSSYSGTTDNHIFQYRDYNSGANNELYIGAGNGGSPSNDQKFGLIKFDLSGGLFTGSETIISAVLKLKFSGFDNGSNTKTHAIAALRRAWGEGTGTGKDGSTPNSGESTWTHYAYTSAWTAVGAQDTSTDRYSADSSTAVSMSTSVGSLIQWDVTTSVQNFVNGTWSNNGWVIYTISGDNTNGSHKFYSRDDSTASNRPILEITYTTGASTKTFTEDVSVFLQATNSITEDINTYLLGTSTISESVNVLNVGEVSFTEDINVYVAGAGSVNITEDINVFSQESTTFTEDTNVYLQGISTVAESINVLLQGTSVINESINVVINNTFNITEDINVQLVGISSITEDVNVASSANTITFTEDINVLSSNQINITEEISTYSRITTSINESINVSIPVTTSFTEDINIKAVNIVAINESISVTGRETKTFTEDIIVKEYLDRRPIRIAQRRIINLNKTNRI